MVGSKTKAFFVLFLAFGLCWGQFHRRDDFHDKRTDWIWITYGAGSEIGVANGCAYLNLTNPDAAQYSNTELVSRDSDRQLYGTLQTRLRTTSMFNGSRGWGWWDRRKDQVLTDFDVAWVMQSKDGGNPLNNWFRWGHCNTAISNLQWWGFPETFDPTQWHTYRMEWSPAGAKLYIDGALFKESAAAVPNDPMSLDIWVDNGYLTYMMQGNLIPAGQSFTGTSSIQVDYVDMYTEELVEHYAPMGSVLLWERPNAFGPGHASSLWKEYGFTADGSVPIHFYITAKAEHYGPWGNDDDLKFQIDTEDFAWDSPLSFNGDQDKGNIKTVSFSRHLTPGAHTLRIFSDMSPLLYDIVAIGGPGGQFFLDSAFESTAPGGTELIWKEFSFQIPIGGEVVALVSASADSGQALRLVLDGQDEGWNGSLTVTGNVLRGDAKTLVCRRILTAGSHTLRIMTNGTPTLHHASIYGTARPGIAPTGGGAWTQSGFRVLVCPGGEIELHGLGWQEAKCTIRDLSGKKVTQVNLSAGKTRLKTNTFPAGIYILEMQNQNKRFPKAIFCGK